MQRPSPNHEHMGRHAAAASAPRPSACPAPLPDLPPCHPPPCSRCHRHLCGPLLPAADLHDLLDQGGGFFQRHTLAQVGNAACGAGRAAACACASPGCRRRPQQGQATTAASTNGQPETV